MRKLYLTGAHGFVGTHVRRLVADGEFGECEVHAPSASLDIRDADGLRSSLAKSEPDWIIHLAAQSFVPASFRDPRETFDVNVLGTLNLLTVLKDCGFTGRMIYVSSGDVYGAVPDEALPVTEARIPEPRNPYAVSKRSAELLCRQWWISEGLDVIIARPFNHIGPDQDERFVVPSLAAQVKRIASGRQEPRMVVGDLDTSRDFSDVRDVVRAYAAMLRSGKPGTVYNVCSGREVRIKRILSMLCDVAGVRPSIDIDEERLRPSQQRRMVASYQQLEQDTGWHPVISLETSLQDIFNNQASRDDSE